MSDHDIPLNAIVTPGQLITLKPRFPKPRGIYWHILPEEKVDAIPVLHSRKPKQDQ